MASEKNIPLIDIHRFMSGRDNNLMIIEDGVHLSDLGYQTAAPYVAQCINAWYLGEIAKDAQAIKNRDEADKKLKALLPLAIKIGDAAYRQNMLAKLDEIWKLCPYLPAQHKVWQEVFYEGKVAPPPAAPAE